VCNDQIKYAWATATLTDNTAKKSSTLLPKTCTNSGQWVQVTSAALTGGHTVTLKLSSQGDAYKTQYNYTLFDDVAVSGSAPPPPPGSCQSNTDCSNGQICVNGTCTNPPPPGSCQSNTDCSNGQVCVNGTCTNPPPPGSCQSNTDCSNGQVCVNGTCTNPPPPPPGGCNTMDDCSGGGLCESGKCVAMACLARASGKTGIRAGISITRYQGIQHGSNGDHEIAYGKITNLLWAHDSSIVNTGAELQLAMNVASSTDPTGLPHEIPLTAGQSIEVEGEYIDGATASGTGGEAVVHFTHSTCGYVTIGGVTYQ
jgi:hypothetical protein